MPKIPLSQTRRVRLGGTFGRRLAIAFAAVAALTAVLAAAILSLVWANQFDAYIKENLLKTASTTANLLSRRYALTGQWDERAFEGLEQYGAMSGLALQVVNDDGEPVYDDTSLGERIYGMQVGRSPDERTPDTPVATAPIQVGDAIVGYVRVWSYGYESLFTEEDQRFRRSALIGLASAAFVAVVLASLAGLIYATRLVQPIERVTRTAEDLRRGKRDARTRMTGGDEIGMLGKTFDEMADAIEADRELERRLTADVAHELRTPLQAIQATVEAMQDGVLPVDEEHLGIVRDETVRLARLADGILELTRLERGTIPMRFERLDLANPVRAAVDTHRALFESCDLVLTLDLAEGVHVMGDADRLQQAVGNLLSNAARYTPEHGRVGVALRVDDDLAVIEVSDTGIGVPENEVGRVFSRFWRADEARDRSTGGLGIGLAVVKEIVDRHGGTVSVSRREGGGSVFSIRMPLASTSR